MCLSSYHVGTKISREKCRQFPPRDWSFKASVFGKVWCLVAISVEAQCHKKQMDEEKTKK